MLSSTPNIQFFRSQKRTRKLRRNDAKVSFRNFFHVFFFIIWLMDLHRLDGFRRNEVSGFRPEISIITRKGTWWEKTWATLEIRSYLFCTYFPPCRSLTRSFSNSICPMLESHAKQMSPTVMANRRFRFEGKSTACAHTTTFAHIHTHTSQHRLHLVTRNQILFSLRECVE